MKVTLLLLVAALGAVQGKIYKVGGRDVSPAPDSLNFFQADQYCKRHGKQLFAPRNRKELEESVGLVKVALGQTYMWVAITNLDQDHQIFYFLHSGNSVNADFWTERQPAKSNQNCTFMTNDKGNPVPKYLEPWDCTDKLRFLCEERDCQNQ